MWGLDFKWIPSQKYDKRFPSKYVTEESMRDEKGRFLKGTINHLTHGQSGKNRTKEYRTWLGMKIRCYHAAASDYSRYGGRGIKICSQWKNSFENFFKDMGKCPAEQYQIDRINCNGDYEPGNCRWVDYKTQMNNTRRSVRIHLRDKSYTVKEICLRYQIDRELMKGYIQRQKAKKLPVTYTEAFFFVCLKKGIKP